ncbi:MAG: hypothetical protein IPL22_10925 [Bacteroidetes bacterium]|nr:hypothetical protein [Bacteroidota bacterium]
MRKLLSILFLVLPFLVNGQSDTKVVPSRQQPTRILFLFDASQSMFARWESDTRFEIAKKLSSIVDSLHMIDNVQTGLRVYGHTKKISPTGLR